MLLRLSACLFWLLPCLATAASLPANPAARRVMAAINRLDADGKGYASEDDFLRGRAFAGTLFSALDANGDGAVDPAEFGVRRDARRAAVFHRLDKKHNRRLTFREFRRGWDPELFTALADQSGRLTAAGLRPGMSEGQATPRRAAPPALNRTIPPPPSVTWPALIGRPGRWALFFPWNG